MSQKAALYKQRGELPVLGERPIPSPTEDQVLVKVLSAGVNSIDWKRIEHDKIVMSQSYPMVLGSDVAGVIASVGTGVKDFKPGDRVFFQGCLQLRDQGGFQQYAVQSHDIVAKTPPHLSDDQAATVPFSSFTALMGLFHYTGLSLHPPPELKVGSRPRPPNTDAILIVGGSTSAGQFALQFAKMVGFKRIITTASPNDRELVAKLGATHVFDRHAPGVAQQVRGIAGEDLRYTFDTISTEDTQRLALEAMAVRHPTYLVTVLPPPEDKSSFPKKSDGSEWKEIFPSTTCWRDFSKPYYRVLKTLLETNQLKTQKPVILKGGLRVVGEALNKLKGGELSAEKLVIRPWET